MSKPAVQKSRAKKRSAHPRSQPPVSRAFNTVASYPRMPVVDRESTLDAVLTADLGVGFTTSVIVNTYYSYSIKLGGFADYLEYVGLFDQYRINRVEVWLTPAAAAGSTVFNQLMSCVDYDDSNVPTSTAQVEGKQGALTTMGGAGHYHAWVPHVANALYSGAFSSYGNMVSPWIDAASINVEHYGFKVAAFTTPVAVNYTIAARIHVTFKSPGI